MKLENRIYEAYIALARDNLLERNSFNFFTVSGRQLLFSNKTNALFGYISSTLANENFPPSIKLTNSEILKMLRAAMGELLIEHLNAGISLDGMTYLCPIYLKGVAKSHIQTSATKVEHQITHYFPAARTGLEDSGPLELGPVTIYNRINWIDSVEFHPRFLKFGGSNNSNWRENLKASLVDKQVELVPLASQLYDTLSKARSILKVTTTGYGPALSEKLATMIARSALDAISLWYPNPQYFRSFLLYTERRPPIIKWTITEEHGLLLIPGMQLSDEVLGHSLSGDSLADDQMRYFAALSKTLDSLLNYSGNHPKLSQRWSTALDWHAEACRETSDLIAVAKFGTCLDVLSSAGGKTRAIANMVSNLTTVDVDRPFFRYGGTDLTLLNVVKKIYENGRSEILHGNTVDRLTPHENLREMARDCSRRTLICAALALAKYDGEDNDKAFAVMESQTS